MIESYGVLSIRIRAAFLGTLDTIVHHAHRRLTIIIIVVFLIASSHLPPIVALPPCCSIPSAAPTLSRQAGLLFCALPYVAPALSRGLLCHSHQPPLFLVATITHCCHCPLATLVTPIATAATSSASLQCPSPAATDFHTLLCCSRALLNLYPSPLSLQPLAPPSYASIIASATANVDATGSSASPLAFLCRNYLCCHRALLFFLTLFPSLLTVRDTVAALPLLPSTPPMHLNSYPPSLVTVCHSSLPLPSLPSLLSSSRARREHHRKSSIVDCGPLLFPYRYHPLLPLSIHCRVSPDPIFCPHLPSPADSHHLYLKAMQL
ncbi:hypothetical protein GW17_00032745 [Ensete ventricosum]|nr:hypothetical protein GW17_00032745 [Ensete ventricosum]